MAEPENAVKSQNQTVRVSTRFPGLYRDHLRDAPYLIGVHDRGALAVGEIPQMPPSPCRLRMVVLFGACGAYSYDIAGMSSIQYT